MTPSYLPPSIAALAARFGSLPAGKPVYRREDFMEKRKDTLADAPTACVQAVGTLCDLVGVQEAPLSPSDMEELRRDIYRNLARRHAYQGTLMIALMSRIAEIKGFPATAALRHLREGGCKYAEIARHFGRPSVPAHVTPIYAIYEGEVALGHPLPALSAAQMEILGIA